MFLVFFRFVVNSSLLVVTLTRGGYWTVARLSTNELSWYLVSTRPKNDRPSTRNHATDRARTTAMHVIEHRQAAGPGLGIIMRFSGGGGPGGGRGASPGLTKVFLSICIQRGYTEG